jgi:hypothetical protein
MQCYNINITLQLTINPFSVITSYNIASHKAPKRKFAAVAWIMHPMVHYHISLFQRYGIFCIWIIAEASRAWLKAKHGKINRGKNWATTWISFYKRTGGMAWPLPIPQSQWSAPTMNPQPTPIPQHSPQIPTFLPSYLFGVETDYPLQQKSQICYSLVLARPSYSLSIRGTPGLQSIKLQI